MQNNNKANKRKDFYEDFDQERSNGIKHGVLFVDNTYHVLPPFPEAHEILCERSARVLSNEILGYFLTNFFVSHSPKVKFVQIKELIFSRCAHVAPPYGSWRLNQ